MQNYHVTYDWICEEANRLYAFADSQGITDSDHAMRIVMLDCVAAARKEDKYLRILVIVEMIIEYQNMAIGLMILIQKRYTFLISKK